MTDYFELDFHLSKILGSFQYLTHKDNITEKR